MTSDPADGAKETPHAARPRQGRLIIVSAPSGAGKTTLCRLVRERIPELLYSVSYTTRSPRPGEIEGRDYHFVTRQEFLDGIARNRWAEWAEVHGNHYGTSADFIREALASGRSVLLDIDGQGAEQIRARFPDSILIFILPPSLEELRRRLESRKSDSEEVIERRLANAAAEMARSSGYDWILVNDHLGDATDRLADFVRTKLA
jgi:guanylate kinase